MKRKVLKNNRGITGVDIVTSVFIITIFAGIIASIIIQISISSRYTKMTDEARRRIVNIFEEADRLYYDEVYVNVNTDGIGYNDGLQFYYNRIYGTNSPYTATVEVVPYNTTTGNTGKLDIVKTINVSMKYTVGSKEYTINMSKVKNRETLITPNKPDIEILKTNLGLTNLDNLRSIKYQNSQWVVCSYADQGWYNYNNGYWGAVLYNSTATKVSAGQTITTDQITNKTYGEIYLWIPKYVYKSTGTNTYDVVFNYSSSSKCVTNVNGYHELIDVQAGYSNSGLNFPANATGSWVTRTNANNNTPDSSKILDLSQYKRKIK